MKSSRLRLRWAFLQLHLLLAKLGDLGDVPIVPYLNFSFIRFFRYFLTISKRLQFFSSEPALFL